MTVHYAELAKSEGLPLDDVMAVMAAHRWGPDLSVEQAEWVVIVARDRGDEIEQTMGDVEW